MGVFRRLRQRRQRRLFDWLISASTREATERVKLVEKELEKLVRAADSDVFARIPGVTPRCPRCRAPMIERRRRDGGGRFWGCAKYPRCRGLRNRRREMDLNLVLLDPATRELVTEIRWSDE
jgi:hypothetical protein